MLYSTYCCTSHTHTHVMTMLKHVATCGTCCMAPSVEPHTHSHMFWPCCNMLPHVANVLWYLLLHLTHTHTCYGHVATCCHMWYIWYGTFRWTSHTLLHGMAMLQHVSTCGACCMAPSVEPHTHSHMLWPSHNMLPHVVHVVWHLGLNLTHTPTRHAAMLQHVAPCGTCCMALSGEPHTH